MHPYDAKNNFFSEMDVLRAGQSKSPRDAVFHVTLELLCAGACGGAGVGVAFVPTECLLLLFDVYNVCVCVFQPLQQPFISQAFLPVLFHAPPCRLLGCLSSDVPKWTVCAHRMLVSLKR